MFTLIGVIKKNLIERYLCDFRNIRVSIDVGCSGAILSADLDSDVKLGLDLSLNFSRKVKAKVSGIVCDIRSIPLKTGSVDCVLCLDVIEHMKDDTGLLKQFYQIMSPNSLLVITTPVKNFEQISIKPLRDLLKLDLSTLNIDFGHVRTGYYPDELKKLLEDQGFHVIAYEMFDGAATRAIDLLFYRPIL